MTLTVRTVRMPSIGISLDDGVVGVETTPSSRSGDEATAGAPLFAVNGVVSTGFFSILAASAGRQGFPTTEVLFRDDRHITSRRVN
jgi:hypothetical protein